jgi:hypothetical protein
MAARRQSPTHATEEVESLKELHASHVAAGDVADEATAQLLAEGEAIEARLTDLAEAAAQAQAQAATAQDAFKASPSPETHSAAAVAAQVASNAKADHAKATADAADTLANVARLLKTRELAELKLRLAAGAAAAETEAFVGLYFEFLEAFKAWIETLNDACASRKELAGRANILESALGTGVRHTSPTPEQVAASINERLRNATGLRGGSPLGKATLSLVEMVPGSQAAQTTVMFVRKDGRWLD